MPRLIWVFAGRTVTLLVLSCRGSFVDNQSNYIIVYININEWHIFLFNIWLCHIFSTYQIQPMYSLSPREKTKGLAKISFPTTHFSSCAYHGPIIGNTGNFHDISFFNLVSKYRNNFFVVYHLAYQTFIIAYKVRKQDILRHQRSIFNLLRRHKNGLV